MMPFSLFLALKYLRPKRSFISVVTVISVLGVLLGVAILVIVLSVMTGFDDMWREKILSFKPHLNVVSRDYVIEDPGAVAEKLDGIPGVRGAAPTVQTRVLLQHEGRTAAPIVIGVDPERAREVSDVSEHIEEGAFRIEGAEMVMGSDLAMSLGVSVGDDVLVYSPMNVTEQDELYLPQEVQVTGIFNMGMRDFDSGYVITSLDVAQALVGLESGASSIQVMIDDPFRFEEMAQSVEKALGPEYIVRTWNEIDRLMFEALRHEKAMMFVLLVFITIVAIFCVTNTLIVITVQKTREIGLLRALGFSSMRIMGAFVWHGWIQCIVGIAMGIGLGFLVLHNLRRIVEWLTAVNVEVFPKEIYGLNEIPWSISGMEILNISLFVMIFCTVSSLIPAYRAARLNPTEALRHE